MRLIFLLLLAVAGCGNPTAETPAPVPAFETPTPLGAPIAAKLYRAEFSNGSWAEPQSLGAPVNIPAASAGPICGGRCASSTKGEAIRR